MSNGNPRETLSVADVVAVIVGIVVGVGIFKTPSLVAANSGSANMVLLFWLLGGAISLLGALCYAELATTYPHAGGDYHYLTRAFGSAPGFLFAWARMTVIQTGSIAMVAFLIGDYATKVIPLGSNSASYYAAAIIMIMTALNAAGIRQGRVTQRALVGAILLGLLFVSIAGYSLVSPDPSAVSDKVHLAGSPAAGKAMIFVLLTYGGWNEAAYLSAEIRNPNRNIVRALLYSIGLITFIYLTINAVFVTSMGLPAMSNSQAIAADLMDKALGKDGTWIISLLVILAALSTLNAAIITGARTNYALGQNFSAFSFLGRWHSRGETPVNALLIQAVISLMLIVLGTGTRSGFTMMVEYTAPVFWFFFLLVGLSIFVLRRKDRSAVRPFRVPLYPLMPLVFCGVCVYMLQSSLLYTGKGSIIGIGVLVAGIPLLLFTKQGRNN